MSNGGGANPIFDPRQVRGDEVLTPTAGMSKRDIAALMLTQSDYFLIALQHGSCRTPNLMTFSEDFTVADWTKTGISSVLGNQIDDPNGKRRGTLVKEDGSNGEHRLESNVWTRTKFGRVALSIFAQKKERNWFVLGFQDALGGGGASALQWFDLDTITTGSKNESGATIESASISESENGWLRCEIVVATQSGTNGVLAFWLSDADGSFSYLGDGASGLYVWGAQAEDDTNEVHCYSVRPEVVLNIANASNETVAKAAYDLAQAYVDEGQARDLEDETGPEDPTTEVV